MTTKALMLNIGGGTSCEEGWLNLDPIHGGGLLRRMAQETPWPFEDSSIDMIHAFHVMEHIPAGEPRIAVMNEAHRVLKPGARMEVRVPFLSGPAGNVWWTAIADPTHVSFWCKESFFYFDGTDAANADYGIRQWETLFLGTTRHGWEGRWVGTPRADEEAKAFRENATKAATASQDGGGAALSAFGTPVCEVDK